MVRSLAVATVAVAMISTPLLAQGRLLTAPNPAKRALTMPLIVIDPGHGGRDRGAVNPRLKLNEADVALALARVIRAKLIATGKYRVLLTRDRDHWLSLVGRLASAKSAGATLFLSIHCGQVADPARSATVFTQSEIASDKASARFAARENQAAPEVALLADERYRNESSILIDLTQREAMNVSAGFARKLATTTAYGRIERKMANLIGIKLSSIPSVLLNAGDITDDQIARKLVSRPGQMGIANAVTDAIDAQLAGLS